MLLDSRRRSKTFAVKELLVNLLDADLHRITAIIRDDVAIDNISNTRLLCSILVFLYIHYLNAQSMS